MLFTHTGCGYFQCLKDDATLQTTSAVHAFICNRSCNLTALIISPSRHVRLCCKR